MFATATSLRASRTRRRVNPRGIERPARRRLGALGWVVRAGAVERLGLGGRSGRRAREQGSGATRSPSRARSRPPQSPLGREVVRGVTPSAPQTRRGRGTPVGAVRALMDRARGEPRETAPSGHERTSNFARRQGQGRVATGDLVRPRGKTTPPRPAFSRPSRHQPRTPIGRPEPEGEGHARLARPGGLPLPLLGYTTESTPHDRRGAARFPDQYVCARVGGVPIHHRGRPL